MHWRATTLAKFGAVLLSCIMLWSVSTSATQAQMPLPRTILAIYDSEEEADLRFFRVHQFAEMPLNHLGLLVEYHDIRTGLPDATRTDVRGILIWTDLSDPALLNNVVIWLGEAARAGKLIVSIGAPPDVSASSQPAVQAAFATVLKHLGIATLGQTQILAFRSEITSLDKDLVGFERELRGPLPAYRRVQAEPHASVHLRVRGKRAPRSTSDLVVLSAGGGYVARNYAVFSGPNEVHRQWILNPFEFFRRAYATDAIPKADVTTLVGRRIYYSHIDGDGWRNISTVEGYLRGTTMAAKVVLEEAIRPFPDLPVTVAPITADLDAHWYGSSASRRIARELFRLGQVELGSHTHTHPFLWRFYSPSKPQLERPFLRQFQTLNGQVETLHKAWSRYDNLPIGPEPDLGHYPRPRAYGLSPFSLRQEIQGSVAIIESLAPPGRRVTVMQWSGDTYPAGDALAATYAAGLENINGGDSRFDARHPSYLFVPAVGRWTEGYRQIYASNSNENTYTNSWTGPYFGFQYLTQTFDNTESPIRVKPANIYYHMYSGEKPAAIKALINNLRWARAHELAPVTTSRFAAIGRGFYTAKFTHISDQRWEVSDRGALSTIRFDHAELSRVDWQLSSGVLGARHFQGSLYVALDEQVSRNIIALTQATKALDEPLYLVHSRWRVYGLTRGKDDTRFATSGYGDGHMTWQGQANQRYRVRAYRDGDLAFSRVVSSRPDGRFSFNLGSSNFASVDVSIELAQ